MGTLPNFDAGPLPLAYLREQARTALVDALDSRRGKKCLVLDPRISGFLGFVTEIALLKEHGVDQLLHLSAQPLGNVSLRNVVYLVRADIANAQHIAAQVKALNRQQGPAHDIAAFFMPRRTHVCDKILEDEGILADVHLGTFPLDFIPFEMDVLSLELPTAFRDMAAEGDPSALFQVARGLMGLQSHFGSFATIKGAGASAAVVGDMLKRMRLELGPDCPPVEGAAADTCILIDRAVDLVTPMCLQLTYEGLVDETLRIANGVVQLDNAGKRERITLNSSDATFRELRDASFEAVGPRLGQRMKALQSDYKDSKATERSLSELKDFAGQLKSLPQIQRHIGVAESVNKVLAEPQMRTRVEIEQMLLDGHYVDDACAMIEELMFGEKDAVAVLRLLCLLSAVQGGLPRKQADSLRRALLHAHGHPLLLVLSRLSRAGLLARQEGGRASFPALKKGLRLMPQGIDNHNPADVAYTYNGYAPISIRLVEAAAEGRAWSLPEDVQRQVPGGLFAQHQADPDQPTAQSLGAASQQRTIVVVFIGGVTFAEIAGLRWLSARSNGSINYVVATTKLVNGHTLLESFLDSGMLSALRQAE